MKLETVQLKHGDVEVLLDGKYLDGHIMQGTLCKFCGWGPLLYTYSGDSEYCVLCNRWISTPCGDPHCDFCQTTQNPPLPQMQGQRYEGPTPQAVNMYQVVQQGHPFIRAIPPRIQIVTIEKVDTPYKPLFSFPEMLEEDRRRLFILIDGKKVEGCMGSFNRSKCCPHCGDQPILWNDVHQAHFCAYCNQWLEPTCQDEECQLCLNRQERPLPSIQGEVFPLDPNVHGVSLDSYAKRQFKPRRKRR